MPRKLSPAAFLVFVACVLAAGTQETADPQRVVLAELFTGAECGPCVAADLAFDTLGQRFDRQTVAVLCYHLNVPGPDPMTNPDSEARGRYYRARATPTILLDGLDMQTGGGSASFAPELFNTCRERVESRRGRRAFARFSNLTAHRAGDSITIAGSVDVASEWVLDPRLRIVLVENGIRYSGSNRVPVHNFVVRRFLGPADGALLRKGSNEFRESASCGSISKELKQHAAIYEKERSELLGAEFRYSGTATTIDPEQVSVVLFIQDARTREVLQAHVAAFRP